MRTEAASILAAVALHAGVILVARAMPSMASLVERDRRPLDTIDIVELPHTEPAPIEAREAPPTPETPHPTEPDRTPPEARPAARAVAPTTGPQAPATAEPENPPPAPTATAPRSKFDELPPDERGGVLGVPGLGGPAAWSIPGVVPGPATAAPAPTVAPAPRPVDKDIAGIVIRDALTKKDKDIGLDLPVAGSMSSAVRTAVNGTELPAGTHGSIECRVAPNGRVTGCRLAGSNGGNSGAWDVAVRAATAVAGSTLTGQYANGAVVTIDVSISDTPPSGSKGGLQGAGASFDLSNIGAHATRNVRTSHRVVAAR